VLHRPSLIDFQSQLEDPFYQPNDRLLVKCDGQLVAHAHLTRRTMHFGSNVLPIAIVNDFVVVPELKAAGIGTRLLSALTERIDHGGAVLAVLRTKQPEFFQSRGWFVCLRHSHSVASPREILPQIQSFQTPQLFAVEEIDNSPIGVRIWRQVELAALIRLYEEYERGSYGPLERSAEYWAWLISRRAFDRLYVATLGPDTGVLDDSASPIVGYAVMREHRILEIVNARSRPSAARELLARACRDAIEHDRHFVQLDAAPDHPLHDIFTSAGGDRCYFEARYGEVFVMHLGNPIRLLRNLGQQLLARARNAGLPLPCELGLRVGPEKYSLSIGPRGLKITPGRHGRSYLECPQPLLSQMLLGHADVSAASESGRLQASTRVAKEIAAVLFPQLPIWRPPWDEVGG
jgi:hypothetical protein